MKILTIIGARPQFIKAAAVSRVIRNMSKILEEVIVHTGQHFDSNMSDVFFQEMDIPNPKYNLDIHGFNHGAMTGRMLEGIEEIILKESPEWVLVYGDTNSTLAGALAAAKLHVKVAHVEAGLRSFNMKMPEEVNRILTDRISTLLFCPTQTAVSNLERDGFNNFPAKIKMTGDVMLDAARFYENQAKSMAKVGNEISYPRFVLGTIHRAENTDEMGRLKEIVHAFNEIHERIPVVLPLHPRTKKKLEDQGIKIEVHVLEPVGYFDMISLLSRCQLVLTDSGGLQKEAYFFEKPCVTFRDETEWVELVEHGVNKLVGTSKVSIIKAADKFIQMPPSFPKGLYGDGHSAEKIVQELMDYRE
jgi:UDP-GlcNAc3NAcA epimerase